MTYGKVKDSDYIIGIFTASTDQKRKSASSITKKEYDKILSMIRKGRKKDERLIEKDGEYYYVVVPGYDDEEKSKEGENIVLQ